MYAQDAKFKKKTGCLKFIFIIILLLILGRCVSFWGFPYLDIMHYLRPPMSDVQIDTLIEPLAPSEQPLLP